MFLMYIYINYFMWLNFTRVATTFSTIQLCHNAVSLKFINHYDDENPVNILPTKTQYTINSISQHLSKYLHKISLTLKAQVTWKSAF